MAKSKAAMMKALRDRRRAEGRCIDCGGPVEAASLFDWPRGRKRTARCRGCADRKGMRKP